MSRLGVRARLIALYGVLFLLAGVLLLAGTYVLADQAINRVIVSSTITGWGDPGQAADPTVEKRRLGELAVTQLALQNEYRRQVLATMASFGGIVLGVLTAGGMGVGWLMASRSMRPLGRITSTARRVTAGRLAAERVALGGPRDEVGQLAESFDAMLGRLGAAFDAQRRFVANASHELRTPLAINRTLLEVALDRPEASADLRALAARLLEVNARQERTLEALLSFARAEEPLRDAQRVELATLAASAAEAVAAEAERAAVAVTTSLEPATVAGEPTLLDRLVTNLVTNAVRHNHPGGTVRVTTAAKCGQAVLTVENTGPVISPDEVEGLFEPFRRRHDRVAGAAVAPGSGLGLSIVRAVAQAHEATVAATARAEGGLLVTVIWPRGGVPGHRLMRPRQRFA